MNINLKNGYIIIPFIVDITVYTSAYTKKLIF